MLCFPDYLGVIMNLLTLKLVCVVACSFSCATKVTADFTMEGRPRGCSTWIEKDAQNLTAYFGWPSVLSFGIVNYISGSDLFRFLNLQNETAICIVRLASTGQVLQNVSFIYFENKRTEDVAGCAFRLPDVSQDTLTAYFLEFKLHDMCGYQKVHIIKENAPVVVENCSNAVHSSHFEATEGSYHELTCAGDNKLRFLTGATDLTYKWLYNCDKEVNSSIPRIGNKLIFKHTSFSFMGQYLCIVEYKGQQLPAAKFDVCIKHDPVNYFSVDPKCTVSNTRLGNDVTISCIAAVRETKVNYFFTGAVWYKGGIKICVYPSNIHRNSRYNCSRESSIRKRGCYNTLPLPEAEVDFYTVNLTIKNINRSDFGEYQVDYKWGLGDKKTLVNVTIEEDITELLENQIVGIAIGTAFVFLIILVLLFCLFRKNDVAWFIKKHFGKYEREPHTYAAYFVYYYDSTDNATGEMKAMKNLVEELHEFMNKFGGTVYDELKDTNVVPSDAENIKRIVGDCHRIIVMLSPSFVRDKWSRYKTNTALTEAVESGRKLIFITIPGTKDAIQNLSEEPRKTLQSAMTINITAEWNGKIPFNGSFRRRLEYGLPKLQRPVYSRYMSDSSQIQLTHQNK